MKLERVRARAFGGLESFDSGEEPLTSLTVVVGPNESGKTTFFHLLGSLIYGLYPTSRDQHPYAPWSGHELHVEADLRVDGDQLWSVRRRLLASPTGLLTRGDDEKALRNETLPCATHVTREVFHQVFALTHAEVATLESEAWSEIQDRLIGAMGARDLVTARAAAEVLEVEARGLWRPDRRGKQEIRELRERIHAATARRRQAADTDRLLRSSMDELEQVRHDLKEAKLVREQQRVLIKHTTTLLPVRKLLDRVAELDEEAGPTLELEGIPSDPVATHERLVTEVAKLQERLARNCEDARAPREHIALFGPDNARILEARADIEDLGAEVAGLRPAHSRLGSLEREIQDHRRHADAALNAIFTRALTEAEESALRRVVPQQLRERIRRTAGARDRQREREMRSTLRPHTPRPSARTLLFGATAGLAAGALWLSAGGEPWPKTVGAVLALVSVTLLTRWGTMHEAFVRSGRDGSPDLSASGGDHTSVGGTNDSETVASALAELRGIFADLPMRDEVLEEAGTELGVAVTRLQEILEDLSTRGVEAEALRLAFAAASERIATVGSGLDLDLPSDDSSAVHVLQTKLRDAERAEEASTSAGRELESLDRARQEIRLELDGQIQALSLLEDSARRLGGENIIAGLEAAGRRQHACQRATQIREDLTRSHPDLEKLTERLDELESSGGRSMGDEQLAAARLSLEEQSDQIEALTGRVKELEHDCTGAGEQATVDQIDGEIEALETDLGHLAAEHDRKLLLAHLIREGDRRFRDEHQPDVVRKASDYLKTITSARYHRITVGEDGSVHVRGPETHGPVEASSLSTGAREQLYLAIRLAVMNHLDEGRERLPVFVDEAFVNWDASRRTHGFELMRELSLTRQVFVMTCHRFWADELVELGARRIDLP